MVALKSETQKKKVIRQEREMFKDGKDYNGSRGCKLCGLYSLEWIQMTNLKI